MTTTEEAPVDTGAVDAPATDAPAAPVDTKTRAESLLATRQKKMDDLFSGRKFEVVKEIHLDQGQLFETPFGNKGRHGFHLRRTEGPVITTEGIDDAKGFIVGATMLEQIAKEYGAVTLPEKTRKRRTKEQKAADDAAAAEAKAAAAAQATETGLADQVDELPSE